jgi:hypothetical protein
MYPASVLGQIGATNVGACIDAIFIKPSANDNTFLRSEVFNYPTEEMNDFELNLNKQVEHISSWVRTNGWRKEGIMNGTCERKYGLCSFYNCCASPDVIANVLLKRDFIQRPFNPLNYSGV